VFNAAGWSAFAADTQRQDHDIHHPYLPVLLETYVSPVATVCYLHTSAGLRPQIHDGDATFVGNLRPFF
jgi:hypothetical protein